MIRQMIHNMKIRTKIIICIVIQVIILSCIIAFISVNYMKGITEDLYYSLTTTNLEADVNSMHQYIENYYGSVVIRDGRLISSKTGQFIESDFTIVDKVSNELKIVASILERRGDVFFRISANSVSTSSSI